MKEINEQLIRAMQVMKNADLIATLLKKFYGTRNK